MTNLSGTGSFETETSDKFTGDEIAMLAFVGVVTTTGIGVLLWALVRAAQDMIMWVHG